MKLDVDHVTVCGSDLDSMRAAFADVGLKTTYGGRHANGVTHMDLLPFEDGSYLELIAPMRSLAGAGSMMAGWAKLMEGDAGAGAWAARCSDIHAEVDRLRAVSIEVRGPEAGSRERPDGTLLEWQTAMLGPGPAGGVLPFLIQDKTPRNLRVLSAEFARGLRGVAWVLIGVHDLERSIHVFQRACEWNSPKIEQHAGFGATLAHFPGTPVTLAAPLQPDSWLSKRLGQFGQCPAAFLLAASELSKAERRFALKEHTSWFGRKISWFETSRLHGTRIGFIE